MKLLNDVAETDISQHKSEIATNTQTGISTLQIDLLCK